MIYPTTPLQPFTDTEWAFLQRADSFYALVRVAFEGVQNSRIFAGMMRDAGWVDSLLEFVIWDGWNRPITAPHSVSYTYVPREFILAQARGALLLLALLPLESSQASSSTRAQVWKASWRIVRNILPGDEYVALELVVQALLDPTSIKLYVENRSADAPLFVDLDEVTSTLVQQIGEGSLVEHSQTLHLNSYSERKSLQLLPFQIPPSLPLLPHWFLMPLIKLRFRTIGESPSKSPFVVSTEKQAVSLLTFVRELETCTVCPLEEDDKAMRCYGLLHVCFAGNEIVTSPAVSDAVQSLLPIYLKSLSHPGYCPLHDDCIHKIEEVVPKKEILGFLEKCCQCIVDEYYYCPLVMQLILLFTYPCRDWNERVLILNHFYDHNYARLLLEADYMTIWNDDLQKLVKDEGISSSLKKVFSQMSSGKCCIWDDKEEVIEMYIRYLEQVSSQNIADRHVLMFNHFLMQILHYIQINNPRYLFFQKQVDQLLPEITVDMLIN